MKVRRAYIDRSVGETRTVVTLGGLPERLLIERPGDPPSQRLGARSTARIVAVEPGLSMAFLRMPDGEDAATPFAPGVNLQEGLSVAVEVVAEPRVGKAAVVRVLDAADGPPRLTMRAPGPEAVVARWVAGEVEGGLEARLRADEAQDIALQTVHPLPGGGSLSIETTRALTAIDVDVGARGGRDAPRSLRQVNQQAIETAARLLRLKGLGGLVVFDLAGKGHNGPALAATAKIAFGPDGPAASIGPISRFGLFELALPWKTTPLAERLLDANGALSAASLALSLLRAIEREGWANPGARLTATCCAEVAEAAKSFLPDLADRIGARFVLDVRPGAPRGAFEVKVS